MYTTTGAFDQRPLLRKCSKGKNGEKAFQKFFKKKTNKKSIVTSHPTSPFENPIKSINSGHQKASTNLNSNALILTWDFEVSDNRSGTVWIKEFI